MEPTPPPPLTPEQPTYVALEGIPLPPFVLILGIVTLFAFLLGLLTLPGSIQDGITFERAKKAIAANEGGKYASKLADMAKHNPGAFELKIELADAYLQNEQYRECADLLDSFEGHSVSKEQEARLTVIEDKFTAIMKKLSPKEGKEETK